MSSNRLSARAGCWQGNSTDYEEDRKKRKGDSEPTRIKYKKLA
jgi:hypothetical protein